MSKIKKEKHKY